MESAAATSPSSLSRRWMNKASSQKKQRGPSVDAVKAPLRSDRLRAVAGPECGRSPTVRGSNTGCVPETADLRPSRGPWQHGGACPRARARTTPPHVGRILPGEAAWLNTEAGWRVGTGGGGGGTGWSSGLVDSYPAVMLWT